MENHWTAWREQRLSRRRALQGPAVAAAGMALVAAGCGGKAGKAPSGTSAGNTSAAPRSGGIYQAAPLASSPPHLDPQQTSSFYTQTPASFVMERLMYYKTALMDAATGASGVPVPGLALSAESPDAITWTAKLRTDVKFQNVAPVSGHPFEAEDVKASWTRALTLKNNPFAGAIDMLDAGQISTPAKDTVVFKLKYPFAPLPSILAATTVGDSYPREALAGSYDPTKQMIGTGPFVFESFTPDIEFVTKRNPDYYTKGLPYVDGTRSSIIPDQAQRLAQFIGGHYDDFPSVPPTDMDAAKKGVPGARWLNLPPGTANMLWLPLGDPTSAFQDIRVRRAFSMAIDRDAIGKAVLQGDYALCYNPPLNLGPKAALTIDQLPASVAPYYKYNPAEAKKQLDAAGVSGMQVIIDHPVPYPQVPGNEPIAEAISNMLNAVGLKSVVRAIDYTNDYLAGGKGEAYGNFPKDHIVISGLRAGSTADPDGRIFDYYHSRSQVNPEHLKDAMLDAMIDKERTMTNQDERYKACIEIQQYVADRMYFIGFMPGPSGHEALQPWIENYYPCSAGGSLGGTGTETISRLWLEH